MSTFLKTHERLILILVVLAGAIYIGRKWIWHLAEVDDAREKQTQQVLDSQKAANEQQAAVVKQLEDIQAQLIPQLIAQNQQLMSGIQARSQVTVVQQQKDKALPLPDLAKRLQSLVPGLETSDVNANETGIGLSDAGARLTTQQLELVPELQSTISDGKQILENKDKEIAAGQQTQTALKDQVSGLTLEIADKDKQCDAKVSVLKAEARKSKWKYFFTGIGVGVGVTVGGLIAWAR